MDSDFEEFITTHLSGVYTFNEGITSIADEAFSGQSIQSVNFPASIRTIGRCAFDCCYDLSDVNFASGFNGEIDADAFLCTGWLFDMSLIPGKGDYITGHYECYVEINGIQYTLIAYYE